MKRPTPRNVTPKPSDPHDLPEFRDWMRDTDLTPRSQHDVCSRLRRLAREIELGKLRSDENVDMLFASRKVASDLTPDVRSQLKRAAKFYLQFLSRRRKQSG